MTTLRERPPRAGSLAGRQQLWAWPGAGALLLIPLAVPPYYAIVLQGALSLSIACLGLNLLLGYTGLRGLPHRRHPRLDGAGRGGRRPLRARDLDLLYDPHPRLHTDRPRALRERRRLPPLRRIREGLPQCLTTWCSRPSCSRRSRSPESSALRSAWRCVRSETTKPVRPSSVSRGRVPKTRTRRRDDRYWPSPSTAGEPHKSHCSPTAACSHHISCGACLPQRGHAASDCSCVGLRPIAPHPVCHGPDNRSFSLCH